MVKIYLFEILHILQLLSVEYRRLQSRSIFVDLRCILIDMHSAYGQPVVLKVIYGGYYMAARSRGGHVMFYSLYKHQWNSKPFHLNIFLLRKARFIM